MNATKALSYAVTLVNGSEGFRAEAYLDHLAKPPVWTIGFGTTHIAGQPVQQGQTCDAASAQAWAMHDMQACCDHVLSVVKVALTDGQLAALISFAYNIGTGAFDRSAVRSALNLGLYQQAADRLLEYDEAGGVVYRGLETRRGRERSLFLLSSPGGTVTVTNPPDAAEATADDLNAAELTRLNSHNPTGVSS